MSAQNSPGPKNGWHQVGVCAQKSREYNVYFMGGEAVAVQLKVFPRNASRSHWRDLWHRKNGAPTPHAAVAIRAAITKASDDEARRVARHDEAFHKAGAMCSQCGCMMVYDSGEEMTRDHPGDAPAWHCTGCGHNEPATRAAAPQEGSQP